jgi:hypothetical protein
MRRRARRCWRRPAPGQCARPASGTPAPPRSRRDITSSSDQLTTTADGQTELTGNVDVHLGEREIQADKLIYDRNNNSLNVSGQVRFHDPTVLVQGDTGRYGDDGALFNHAQFQLLQQSGHGSADQISMTPERRHHAAQRRLHQLPAAARHLADSRARTAPRHRRRRGRRPRRDPGRGRHPDRLPAVDLVSAERCAQERLPVSGNQHLQPQRRHARYALVLEHRAEPGCHLHADLLHEPRPRPGCAVPLPEQPGTAAPSTPAFFPTTALRHRLELERPGPRAIPAATAATCA